MTFALLQARGHRTGLRENAFFNRSTLSVARDLLGKELVRKASDGQERIAVITETEAYDGPEDKASHAHRGCTPRNSVMFGPPGIVYVYLCYGMHWMLNIVTREEGFPAAVLVRGTSSVSGPGRLTRFFEIDKRCNGLPLSPLNGLWVRDPLTPVKGRIRTAPRVGVGYAGDVWAAKPWRYLLELQQPAAHREGGGGPC